MLWPRFFAWRLRCLPMSPRVILRAPGALASVRSISTAFARSASKLAHARIGASAANLRSASLPAALRRSAASPLFKSIRVSGGNSEGVPEHDGASGARADAWPVALASGRFLRAPSVPRFPLSSSLAACHTSLSRLVDRRATVIGRPLELIRSQQRTTHKHADRQTRSDSAAARQRSLKRSLLSHSLFLFVFRSLFRCIPV